MSASAPVSASASTSEPARTPDTSTPAVMRGSARVAIVGNCQALPLGRILPMLSPGIEIVEPVVVHLARQEDEEAAAERLASADIVLAQLVADNYPTSFVRLSELQARHGDKVVPWLNLYWRGRNPELVYKREFMGRAVARNMGGTEFPLGAYHIEPVHEGWLAGLDAAAIAARLADPDLARERYGDVARESLDELRSREARVPVPITDVIEERAARSDLFHVFNHPTTELMAEYARRMLALVGLPTERFLHAPGWEPLGSYLPPPSPVSTLPPWPERTYRVLRRGGPYRLMTELEVVEGFLTAYEAATGAAAPADTRSG